MIIRISKIYYAIIVILLCSNILLANSLLELLSLENETIGVYDRSFLSTVEEYSDLYYLSRKNGEKHYLYSNNVRINYKTPLLNKNFLNIALIRSETNFFLNDLNSLNDRIKFYSTYSQVKIEFSRRAENIRSLYEFSCQRSFNKFRYSIVDESF